MKCVSLGLTLAVTACTFGGAEPEVPWPLGTPADVRTAPGDYGDHRVVMPCQVRWGWPVGIIGKGSVTPTREELLVLGNELYTTASSGPYGDVVFGGGGIALPCESALTTTLMVGDWRVVDQAIADAAAWLRAHDLAIEVVIDVEGPAIPALE